MNRVDATCNLLIELSSWLSRLASLAGLGFLISIPMLSQLPLLCVSAQRLVFRRLPTKRRRGLYENGKLGRVRGLRQANAGTMNTGLVDGKVPAPNLERSILDRLKGKPGGVSLIEVRASLKAGGKAKAEFDKAVLSLYQSRLVYLDQHDHPLRLSDADRRDLVFDGIESYYVGITLRGDVE